MLSRDYKFFEAARKAAGESTFRVQVGAVAVYGGKVIASAASMEKTHPLQKQYNRYRSAGIEWVSPPKLHAEIGLLAKLKKMNVPMRDVSVYVYRICKSRKQGMARPCKACLVALAESGIRNAWYTTDCGYAREWIAV